MSFNRDRMKARVAELASRGVFIGTSSWKYEGWLNQLYTPARYEKKEMRASRSPPSHDFLPLFQTEKGVEPQVKVDSKLFDRECLSEYAEVFKTVSVDGAYYKFPTREYLERLADQVPDDFRFGFKVTDAMTRKRFSNQERSGKRAGLPNPDFLNANLFVTGFLKPCEHIRAKIGVLMFEFSRFYPADYEEGPRFVADLDAFLGKLPKGWPYAVEMRNKHWLSPEYFQCLTRHGVTHVFNSWEAMPSVSEQMGLASSRTNSDLVAARFLLKPGRKYDEAVDKFKPYKKVQEVNEEARKAAAQLLLEGLIKKVVRSVFVFVNNRLEGNALETIDEMLARVTAMEAAGNL